MLCVYLEKFASMSNMEMSAAKVAAISADGLRAPMLSGT